MHSFWQLGLQRDGRYRICVHRGKKKELVSISTNVTFEDLADCIMSRPTGVCRGGGEALAEILSCWTRGTLKFTSNTSAERLCTGVIADTGATVLYGVHVLRD